jgi:hypothetical protein
MNQVMKITKQLVAMPVPLLEDAMQRKQRKNKTDGYAVQSLFVVWFT